MWCGMVLLDVKGSRNCNKNLQSRANHLHTPRLRDGLSTLFCPAVTALRLDALDALVGTAMAVKRKTDSSAATVAQKKSRTGRLPFTHMTLLPADHTQSLPRLPQIWTGLPTIRRT